MSRQKILVGTFFVGLLVLGGFFVWQPDYWSEVFPSKNPGVTPGMAGTRPAARPASTRPVAANVPPTLMRELPRQALLITATHDFGLPISDRAVDFAGPDRGPGMVCRPVYDWSKKTAMETQEWTAVCRPQAAAGLRRLGDPYYK